MFTFPEKIESLPKEYRVQDNVDIFLESTALCWIDLICYLTSLLRDKSDVYSEYYGSHLLFHKLESTNTNKLLTIYKAEADIFDLQIRCLYVWCEYFSVHDRLPYRLWIIYRSLSVSVVEQLPKKTNTEPEQLTEMSGSNQLIYLDREPKGQIPRLLKMFSIYL